MEYAQLSPNLQFELESSLMLKGKKHVVDIWTPQKCVVTNKYSLEYWRNLQIHTDPRASRQAIVMDLGNTQTVENIISVTDKAIKASRGSVQLITGVKPVGLDLLLANIEKHYEIQQTLHFIYSCNVPYEFDTFTEWKSI
eukprot:530363_1